MKGDWLWWVFISFSDVVWGWGWRWIRKVVWTYYWCGAKIQTLLSHLDLLVQHRTLCCYTNKKSGVEIEKLLWEILNSVWFHKIILLMIFVVVNVNCMSLVYSLNRHCVINYTHSKINYRVIVLWCRYTIGIWFLCTV